ncbi:VOC family protein [Thalassotalea mangrovi]|uniref:VOC family protein n=1 Tax=Thalassotalea mangrovi TaxID=2572245 RepID=A0A4V5NTY4_9GAMM|nr:VOC family protein [Thalassotalea mangrovi]TKB43629.1 VOC family protein [Thalassotalea mangrovi]
MMNNNITEMAWLDLTVQNAEEVRDFYQQVIGWEVEACSMGEYDDYAMNNPVNDSPQAGICHARGVNADLPPVWMPYFLVADMDASIASVTAKGGKLLTEVKSMGGDDKYVVIKDPAGAVCALYYKK